MKYLLLFLIVLGVSNCSTNESNILALKGATIYDGHGGIIKNGVIIIDEYSIDTIGDSNINIPDNAKVIDVTDKFITPGLVDAHVHFSQTGFFDSRPDLFDVRDSINYDSIMLDLEEHSQRFFEAYLRSGITAVYDVGGYTWTIDLQNNAENDFNAPHVAASGPLLSPLTNDDLSIINTTSNKQIFHLESEKIGIKAVKKNTALGSTGIKILTIDLTDTTFLKSLRAVANEANTVDNQLIVHAMKLDQAKEALRLKTKLLVHSVDDKQVDDEFIELAKKADVTYCPTFLVERGYYNAIKALTDDFQITDPNNVVDEETKALLASSKRFFQFYPDPVNYNKHLGDYEKYLTDIESNMSYNLKKLHEAGIRIAVGTDAGNPGVLHGISIYDEMSIMQKSGIPAKDIIIMATKNGAIAMNRIDDFGTLEKGKFANLVVTEKDPGLDINNYRSITHVMLRGLIRPVNKSLQTTANKVYRK